MLLYIPAVALRHLAGIFKGLQRIDKVVILQIRSKGNI